MTWMRGQTEPRQGKVWGVPHVHGRSSEFPAAAWELGSGLRQASAKTVQSSMSPEATEPL